MQIPPFQTGSKGSNNAAAVVEDLRQTGIRYWLVVFAHYKKDTDLANVTGHSWIALIDTEAGAVRALGFYPDGALGRAPDQDKAPGTYKDDSQREYTVARAYPISEEQLKRANRAFNEIQQNPGQYDVQDNNCTTWAKRFYESVLGVRANVPETNINLYPATNDLRRPDYTPKGMGDFLLRDNHDPRSRLYDQGREQ